MRIDQAGRLSKCVQHDLEFGPQGLQVNSYTGALTIQLLQNVRTSRCPDPVPSGAAQHQLQ